MSIQLLTTGYPENLAENLENPRLFRAGSVKGLALLQGDKVIWAAELVHRVNQITCDLASRSVIRRHRRNRKTRYRQPRFLNRTRTPGWLPPSLASRGKNS
ncbi:RRXRR domain-containing protein [Microseira sp. BLCC-F43]|uniref:RRXRR domain-containing protein n=1 Tax=Microseira sp. BLCC-F43 TaxID=3153602 RepID=UPI0035B9CE0D